MSIEIANEPDGRRKTRWRPWSWQGDRSGGAADPEDEMNLERV